MLLFCSKGTVPLELAHEKTSITVACEHQCPRSHCLDLQSDQDLMKNISANCHLLLPSKCLTSQKHTFITLTPLNPTFIWTNWGLQGIQHFFLISSQKHRLWVLVRTTSARRFYGVSKIYVLSRNMKNSHQRRWQIPRSTRHF